MRSSGQGTSTDGELVLRFREGDRHAFSQLVRRYQDRVYGLCFRWLGSPTEAEEVAQDVFMAVFKGLQSFRGDSALSTWIFRITLNHCKNKVLRRQRRGWGRHDPLETPPASGRPSPQLTSGAPGPDGALEKSEAEQLVQEGLAALSDEHREVLLLRDLQDMDYDEISDLLEIPRGTVKSRLHRARTELARVLGNRSGQGGVKRRHG